MIRVFAYKLLHNDQGLLALPYTGQADTLAKQRVGAHAAVGILIKKVVKKSYRGGQISLIHFVLSQAVLAQLLLELLILG